MTRVMIKKHIDKKNGLSYQSFTNHGNIELPNVTYDWTTDSMKCSARQIGEMLSSLVTLKENLQLQLTPPDLIDVTLSVKCKSLRMT